MDNIEKVNLVPRFLLYYHMAKHSDVDAVKRWSLWEEHYNFAAVPPGEQGKIMARKLLDNAWEKYSDNLFLIEKWEPEQDKVNFYLQKIKTLLGYEEAIKLVIVYFVGGFENNPFVAPYDKDRLALCLPIESDSSEIMLAHELTHIVHSHTANLSGEWERTIASTILQEGLATQVSKYLVPGYPDAQYIEHKNGWFGSCKQNQVNILKGIYPYLDHFSSEAVTMFTFGMGTTNREREAYYAGWVVVEYLLKKGLTFKDIASIQEKDIPNFIRENYTGLLE